jgi:hypothetical protein
MVYSSGSRMSRSYICAVSWHTGPATQPTVIPFAVWGSMEARHRLRRDRSVACCDCDAFCGKISSKSSLSVMSTSVVASSNPLASEPVFGFFVLRSIIATATLIFRFSLAERTVPNAVAPGGERGHCYLSKPGLRRTARPVSREPSWNHHTIGRSAALLGKKHPFQPARTLVNASANLLPKLRFRGFSAILILAQSAVKAPETRRQRRR